MSWVIEAIYKKRGVSGEFLPIIPETTPPTEQKRYLISEVIRKLTDRSTLWRRRPVYNWAEAFDVVKRLPDHGLTADEKEWMLGKFELEMQRCAEESRKAEGYFHHPTALCYPEGYVAVRAGGFEVPILSPAELKWGGRTRGARVGVAEQLLGFFEEIPIISPNNNLFGHMRTILKENMKFINAVFGFVYSELDLTVVNEGKFGLKLGRKKPGVLFNVLHETIPVTA